MRVARDAVGIISVPNDDRRLRNKVKHRLVMDPHTISNIGVKVFDLKVIGFPTGPERRRKRHAAGDSLLNNLSLLI